MDLDEATDRMTYLLKDHTVEHVSQDSSTHMTTKFKKGPVLRIGLIQDQELELDCTVTADVDTDESWIELAEDPSGPRPIRR